LLFIELSFKRKALFKGNKHSQNSLTIAQAQYKKQNGGMQTEANEILIRGFPANFRERLIGQILLIM